MSSKEMEQELVDLNRAVSEYQSTHPGKAYPETIRQTVRDLIGQGMSCQHVAAATGLPAASLYHWSRGVPRPKKKGASRIVSPPPRIFDVEAVPPPAGQLQFSCAGFAITIRHGDLR